MVLCSTLALDTLAVGGGARINILGHGRRAHETDRPDLGMIEKSVHGLAAAVDKPQNPFRKVEFFHQPEHVLHG